MKLRRCNKYMFQTVKCSKYMRKINDGKCITLLTGDETENGKPAYFYTDYSEKIDKISLKQENEEEKVVDNILLKEVLGKLEKRERQI